MLPICRIKAEKRKGIYRRKFRAHWAEPMAPAGRLRGSIVTALVFTG
ncbi:hypothetical protein [Sphingopyxis sp. BSNA05]|nr:hypothetical protein [Sphingopyxis sp. BSNA05]